MLVVHTSPAVRLGLVANLWILSPNKLRNHDTPAERIQHGLFRSVLAIIEALADGVVV